jgi:phosphonate transport system permease protein
MKQKMKKYNNQVIGKLELKPKTWIYNLILYGAIIGTIIYSFIASEIVFKETNLLFALQTMVNGFLNPNLEFLFGLDTASIPYLTLETISIAFVGTFIASILAIPFGFLTAKNVVGKNISKIGEFLLIIIRVFPEIALALILIRVIGIGATNGAITIGIHSIGMLGKLYAEAIENMDTGPLEALDAVGANTWQKIRYAIIPQVLPDFLSTALYRLDINVRSATVLGMVAAGGLGAPLIFASELWEWNSLSSILIAIVIMVMTVDFISSYLRSKLV